MSAFKTLRLLGLSSSLLILAACGGGGGDSGGTTTPPAATYTVGGTVTGLTGTLVLANGGANTSVTGASFTVLSAATAGTTYAVTVATQPSGQTCTVANGSGTVGSANVTNIAVTCVAAPTFTVTGTVTGHTGTVVLANAGVNISVAAGTGTFSVLSAATTGTTYAVTVGTNPTGQTCVVANGSGTVASANISNIAVTCTTNAANTFTVGGTVSGLGASLSVVLQSTGYTDVTVNLNTTYAFAAKPTGTTYNISVKTQPTGQTCTVAAASGTIAAANVTNVNVTCTTNAASTFTVGGTVTGLATGGNVVLQNNAGNNLTVSASGSFTFTTALATGATYAVTRLTNPTLPAGTPAGQTCTVTNGSGTIASANVTNVAVACVNNDTTAPTITAKTPLAYTIGTALSTTIAATFSETLDTATVTASTFTVKAGNLAQSSAMTTVAGTLAFTTVSGGTKVTFTPTAALSYDTDYAIAATTGVKDVAGNAVAATSWSFNTGKRITTGGSHACARFADGRAKCWGYNGFGQLGINNSVDHGDGNGLMGNGTGAAGSGLLPVIIPTTSALNGRTIVAMGAGDDHTCAIVDNGNVFCWGHDTHGELGNGFTATSVGSNGSGDMEAISAVNLGAGRTAIQITLGNEMTCALLDDYSVKCWGWGLHGALGQGNTSDSTTPVLVSLGTGRTVKEVSAGGTRACVILDNDALKCWGDNRWGQAGLGLAVSNDVGDGASEMGDNLTAVNIGSVTPLHLAVADGHICVLSTAGAVRCWGNDTWGQIANPAGNGSPSSLNDCTSSSGRNCWGDSSTEMGDNLPQPIASGGAVEVTVGYRQSCARLVTGPVKCWGTNEHGQIGLDTNVFPLDDVGDSGAEASALANAILKPARTPAELSGGGFFECVTYSAADGGQTQCWGSNSNGQIGMDNTSGPLLKIGDNSGEMGNGLTDINLGT